MTAISNTYEKPSHPIKVVATRTGLSKDVIRVWEKRYQAINPQRSDTGRRLYTDADIAHLLKLKQAISGGWRISDVAKLSKDELDTLIAAKSHATKMAESPPSMENSIPGEATCRGVSRRLRGWMPESLTACSPLPPWPCRSRGCLTSSWPRC